MSIVRVNKDAHYFTASNEPFNDKRLRWETRGLMGYLLSKPNNWTIRMEDLMNQGPGGRDKVRKMLKDAQVHGYLNRVRVTRKDHTFYWVTEIYESPSLNPNPQASGGFSATGQQKPVAGFPVTGKPTDIISTDLINTEEATTRDDDTQNIFTLYEQNIGLLTPMIALSLGDAEEMYGPVWIGDAIKIAVENNKRNWKYCEAILKRWATEGKDDGMKPKSAKGKKKQTTAADALDGYLEKMKAEV